MKQEKRLITKQLLRKYGFVYLEQFGFWYRRISFRQSYNGLTFRYRYDKRELETQRFHVIGGEDSKYHNEEEGYKLIKEYAKRYYFDKQYQ